MRSAHGYMLFECLVASVLLASALGLVVMGSIELAQWRERTVQPIQTVLALWMAGMHIVRDMQQTAPHALATWRIGGELSWHDGEKTHRWYCRDKKLWVHRASDRTPCADGIGVLCSEIIRSHDRVGVVRLCLGRGKELLEWYVFPYGGIGLCNS